MGTEKNRSKTYIARNKDGFPCAYDSETHRCIDVILSTGDDVEYFKKHYNEYIGQLDPAFAEQA